MALTTTAIQHLKRLVTDPTWADASLKDDDRLFEIEITWLLRDLLSLTPEDEIEEAWRLRQLVREMNELEGLRHRRSNPKARATHQTRGRKDHGTSARRRQIESENAVLAEGQQSKRTVRRQRNKNMARSGNPRRYKAALKRQARTKR